jgi:hypothetical protein
MSTPSSITPAATIFSYKERIRSSLIAMMPSSSAWAAVDDAVFDHGVDREVDLVPSHVPVVLLDLRDGGLVVAIEEV